MRTPGEIDMLLTSFQDVIGGSSRHSLQKDGGCASRMNCRYPPGCAARLPVSRKKLQRK
jgi:hypothetical protein